MHPEASSQVLPGDPAALGPRLLAGVSSRRFSNKEKWRLDLSLWALIYAGVRSTSECCSIRSQVAPMLPGHLWVVVLGFLPWTHASVIRALGSLEAYA